MKDSAQRIRVAIAPWPDAAVHSVLVEAGFSVVDSDGDYEALLWLDRLPGDVEDYLGSAPSLSIVQAAETGQEKWGGLRKKYPWLEFRFAGNAYSKEVAEHGLALVLALIKSLDLAATSQRWGRVHAQEIGGRTVLVAGFGGIGRHMARILTAMGARCYGMSSQQLHAPDGKIVDLDPSDTEKLRVITGVERWDIIANCLPLNHTTEGFFTLETFRRLARDSIFINVGRGGTVDQDGLRSAMTEGLVRAAGLDVTVPEPLPEDHPLWTDERVLITSHSGNPAASRSTRLASVAVQNFRAYVDDHIASAGAANVDVLGKV